MKTSSRRAKPLVICLWQDGVFTAAYGASPRCVCGDEHLSADHPTGDPETP
jgi:hypothetical protein